MLDNLIASFESNIIHFEPSEFWIGFTVATAIALWSFIRMLRAYQYAHMIDIVPTAKVRSAAQGYVELVGNTKLMDGPLIVSPLKRKVCVWFHYKIEERVKRYDSKGRSNSHWRVVEQKTSEELFLLQDDTGRCVIDPDDADVIATEKETWHKHNVHPPRRYTEEIISENVELYAIGLFKTVANVESRQFSQQVSHLLRQWKRDPNQLMHDFDSDRNNELSQQEWEQARLKAEAHIRMEHGQREKMEQLSVLQSSPHKDQAFILSTIPEQQLIRRYYLRALGCLTLFLTTGSVLVWALNIRLGQ